ncbi:hypothetical protein ACWFMI_10465 [Nocardiopsis terrae]
MFEPVLPAEEPPHERCPDHHLEVYTARTQSDRDALSLLPTPRAAAGPRGRTRALRPL